jgi:hypothetical protein
VELHLLVVIVQLLAVVLAPAPWELVMHQTVQTVQDRMDR